MYDEDIGVTPAVVEAVGFGVATGFWVNVCAGFFVGLDVGFAVGFNMGDGDAVGSGVLVTINVLLGCGVDILTVGEAAASFVGSGEAVSKETGVCETMAVSELSGSVMVEMGLSRITRLHPDIDKSIAHIRIVNVCFFMKFRSPVMAFSYHGR